MTIPANRLRELATRATPGPWSEINGNEGTTIIAHGGSFESTVAILSVSERKPDRDEMNGEFIAALNPTMTIEILDELDLLRKSLKRTIQIAERSRPDSFDRSELEAIRKAANL
jgi:hypothetical protein